MKIRNVLALFVVMAFTFTVAGISYSSHKEEKGVIKGTITKVEVTEYELTVKDNKGQETKVKGKGAPEFKVGDNVVVKDGKATKAVKPLTGGY
jgi:hypothetical protein